ncbi:NAD(P)H-dependent oxidoreductase [Massilia antarctica]|uniref:NAD(P)H-dependent oxidoreductase n=1 Tax=Massilia antarctica TaxID=2765360 RepID=A0AA49AAQ5_9BURK|nr:NADPH-dependent FMN reductase [Massilia antarctica]QPI52878.1 NAD(P)H-dependent oxidoreductase [Massilia antarctica]
MKTLIALSGSLRRDSANTALLRAALALAPPGVRVVVYEGTPMLPFFNPDIEADPPSAVRELRALLSAADGVIVASPEYAHGVPGAFKNMLDWLVGCAELGSKPVALINTSARAVHAQAALAEILTTMGWRVIAAASPVIAVANRGFDQAHIAADPALAGPLLMAIGVLVQADADIDAP